MALVDAEPDSRALTHPNRSSRAPRGDIQALRALAVTAVVLFHVWPRAVTGGYVGVDVFFVISGYLITGQLVRRRDRGTLRLSSFWAARARRLLPAALLVLLASTALTLVFAQQSLITQYLRSIIGSTLYVENWLLAADAVDYLAAENAPPIAQHYWSLSVEEQFYILWPLLIIVATMAAVTKRFGRHTLIVVLSAVTAASLGISLVATFVAPSFAYFATPVRIWEFGFGALIAVLPVFRLAPALRSVLWVSGWAALLYSVFFFTSETAFPGYAAILPVAATAVLILIGPEPPFRLASAQNWRLVQWIGDNSYGIYLWHWPLVVIAPAVLGRDLELWQNIVLVLITCALAVLGRRFVEEPLRFGRASSLRPRWVAGLSIFAMLVVLASAVVPIALNARETALASAQAQTQLTDPAACRGASVLLEPDCHSQWDDFVTSEDILPRLEGLYDDVEGAYACYSQDESAVLEACTIGSTSPDSLRIAITGDSHAGMLLPALRMVAEANNWSIDVYVGRGCLWKMDEDQKCTDRREKLTRDLIQGGYDAVLVTGWNQIEASELQRTQIANGYANMWRMVVDAGVLVVPILDNPAVPAESAECLATASEFNLATCSFSASENLRTDPLMLAADALNINAVDLRDAYCTPHGQCPMVAGGVVVYRDLHHITGTFSKTLAPYLSEQLTSVLAP